MKTKYYFSLEEFVGNETHWKDLLGKTNTATQAQVSDTLLTDYIIPRYSDSVVHISSSETPDYTVLKGKMLAWLNSTYPYYNKLISLYSAQENNLLEQLSTTITDTRATVKTGGNTNTATLGITHTVNRENDTPQEGGSFDDDNHTSNIMTTDTDEITNTYELVYDDETSTNSGSLETVSDPTTIIDRLNEIREKYVNFYREWCESFRAFVYIPADFEESSDWGYIYYED